MMETNLNVRNFDSPLSPDDFRKVPRHPVHVVLDNLRSAFNVGSIVRTADSALVERIYFCGYTAHPPHKKLEKTSLGALPYVPWEYSESALPLIHRLKSRGIRVVALETTNQSRILWDYVFPAPVAIVMGNEALGISENILAEADDIVEIPMLGFKNSINVAVAFGMAVYEIQRQNRHQLNQSRLVRHSPGRTPKKQDGLK